MSQKGLFKCMSYLVLLALPSSGCLSPDGPRINDDFPIREGRELSPPIVYDPIHECAQVVYVFSFVPHATVTVYANMTEQVGQAAPHFAFADIPLTRPLKLGEKITATQTIVSQASAHTVQPVEVTAYPPEGLGKPVVGNDIYECGVIVPVDKLSPSVTVKAFEDVTEVGSAVTPDPWVPVWTQPLHVAKHVTAQQFACEGISTKEIKGPVSEPVSVKPASHPMPKPGVDPQSLVVGNDTVTLTGLYVGAQVVVSDNGVKVGSGWATGGANWCPLTSVLTSTSNITATQELCGDTSPPSDPVEPLKELKAPKVLSPICDKSQFVILRDTIVNANVVVFRNNQPVGYSGAISGDLIVTLSGAVHLTAGDVVTARQYLGSNVSPLSNAVTVSAALQVPAVEVLGGEPFFLREGNEQPIGGAVFPRGRGAGPDIRIQACCSEQVNVQILAPDGTLVANPTAKEQFPGYFTAVWDWRSTNGWSIPSQIPIGEYTLKVRSGCDQREVSLPFYVIFNPDDVSGPGRFAFDETNVWFATGSNSTRALIYHLHPDDNRVFSIAIKAAQGQTDPLEAAKAISDAEEALFAYSLNYHTNDVLDMLTNYSEAQCADDASTLVALLRSVGIPAHTASADAALETGDANWTFDTWTEFLVPKAGTPEWLILHPHEYPTMNPETRAHFGGNQPVATKEFNDLVLMADENWDWSEASDSASDVSYKRNTCLEPEQAISKKVWIGELCERGYWSPNHWSCEGMSSHGLSLPGALRLDLGDAGFGRSLRGSFTLQVRDVDSLKGELTIAVVADLPESKKFPDETYETKTYSVNLKRGEQKQFDFDLRLPPTAPPGYELYVQVRLGERILAVQAFRLETQLRAELQLPKRMQIGEEVTIKAYVRNISKRTVNQIQGSLRTPFAIKLERGEPQLQVQSLKPDEETVISWTLRVVAPAESAAVRLLVSSADGGPSDTIAPFSIPGASSIRDVQPIQSRR